MSIFGLIDVDFGPFLALSKIWWRHDRYVHYRYVDFYVVNRWFDIPPILPDPIFFSHHYTHHKLQFFIMLWTICGQLSCTALTPVFLTCGYSYFIVGCTSVFLCDLESQIVHFFDLQSVHPWCRVFIFVVSHHLSLPDMLCLNCLPSGLVALTI